MTIENSFLKVGDDSAPLKLEAFLNASCPGSALFYNAATKILPTYIEENKIQLIVKLYDKPREELLHGTLIHLCLEYDKPKKTLDILKDLLETQSEWLEFTDKEIKNLLITKYDLHEEEIEANTEISLGITAEAIKRNVKIVPTLFINGVRQKFSFEDLKVIQEFRPEDLEGELRKFVQDAIAGLELKA